MTLSVSDKAKVVEEHARSKGDTGSPEVQVALMTARIKDLTDHFSNTYSRPSFSSGFVATGKPATKVAGLFKTQRCRALQKSYSITRLT